MDLSDFNALKKSSFVKNDEDNEWAQRETGIDVWFICVKINILLV
jgi:hypothetical protein